jgi:hypothetical protein
MSRVAPYDVAAVFRAEYRSAIARGQLAAGGLVRVSADEPGILCVAVAAAPPFAFEPDFLEHGPGRGAIFTPRGDEWWQGLHEIAMATVLRADPDGVAALLLHPDAYADAPWRQPAQVAA